MEYIRWLWSDRETMRPVGGPLYLTDDEAGRWFALMIDPGDETECYRLILNENKEPIGEVSFHHLDLNTMTAMFNLKVVHSERGKGYGQRAMLLFLRHFFYELGGKMMVDDIALDNLQGRKVLVQFGFVHDPSQREVFRVYLTKVRFHQLHGNS
jgi:RimJ/RimL family protein N-acetyltransferase